MDKRAMPGLDPAAPSELRGDERHSALFMQLILQQTNMVMHLLGKLPHPESGKGFRDLDGAQLLIDELEALEAKTRGNLNKQEEALLKQSLMTLRLAFVDAAGEKPAEQTSGQSAAGQAPAAPSEPPSGEAKNAPPETAEAPDEASPKRFSKKYSS